MEIIVRKVENHKTGQVWFQQKTKDGKGWFDIPKTKFMCEGNARHALAGYIEDIKERHLRIMTDFGKEETHLVYQGED